MKFNKNIVWLLFIAFFAIAFVGCKTDDVEDPIVENPIDEEPIDEEPIQSDFEKLEEWIIVNFQNKQISEDQVFPTTNPEIGGTIKWQSFDQDVLTAQGKYTAPVVDKDIELVCTISLNGESKMLFIPVVVKGYGTPMDAISLYVENLVKTDIVNNVFLPQTHPQYPCVITWKSSREDILDNAGNLNKPTEDVALTLTYQVVFMEESKEFMIPVVAKGLTDLQKAHEVILDFDKKYAQLTQVESNLNLEQQATKYAAVVTWESNNPAVVSSLGEFQTPLYDQSIRLTVTISVNNQSVSSTYQFVVKGGFALNKWDQITSFLNAIAKPDVNTIRQFYLFGSEAGYEKVPSQNKGYLPFYDEEPMTIIQEIVPMTNMAIRPGRNRTETKYIVIHNTGMAAPTATAKQLSKAIQNSTRQASWHFSIDDHETYQQLGINEVGWHAGESNGNNYGIGIESCVYQGVDFNQVLRRLAKLTAKLLIDFDLGFDDIKQHYDFSGKNCPQVIRESNRWDEFIDLVQIEYFAQTNLAGVTFVWKSLSPEVLSDDGKVINHPGQSVEVSYEVSVTFQNETRIFHFNSTLKNL